MIPSPQAKNTKAYEIDESASIPPTSPHHIILSFETKSHAGIVDIVVIDDLLMKKDIDEIGHVMIGHEVGQLKQMQVDHW
ncbi:hypothetical protein Tco_0738177 [Tanacetum coccineum]